MTLPAQLRKRRFYIFTLFPEEATNWLIHSITLKSIYRAPIEFKVINIRQKVREQVDYPPYGGKSGMVLSIVPIYNLLSRYNLLKTAHIILLCPRSPKFTQSKARDLEKLSADKPLVFICGHYEGIDERIKHFISEAISIGDYILSSGTLAASVLVESIVRLIPSVIKTESLESESFNSTDSIEDLDFPVYAPPREFLGYKVPEVLFSGHHSKIEAHRKRESKKALKT
ncbi:tRNA (guanine(37)-N(1))-methyltransferase [Candidatus Mycoplasma haematominutum]|uniref:tRNA (guanine-N(1)-)-methyltransferase n=1 Tax=Candidatus Mycoplasma haematominutum 'Birmingham 1' TaxID=1116213 RepID=G8C342_9MOLU|nr:tRNA (guanine(37)-N(1))-methyltransferase [Candidatus Mycoplasma haematominutum]CCE66740.1 tRNA (Guanine37-N1)-methyltransferase [Candidatus Mycoplasma haematominutum 'Birmingham 1']